MFCKNCGKEINEKSAFCTYCGSAQTALGIGKTNAAGFAPAGSFPTNTSYTPTCIKKKKSIPLYIKLIAIICSCCVLALVITVLLCTGSSNSEKAYIGNWTFSFADKPGSLSLNSNGQASFSFSGEFDRSYNYSGKYNVYDDIIVMRDTFQDRGIFLIFVINGNSAQFVFDAFDLSMTDAEVVAAINNTRNDSNANVLAMGFTAYRTD